MHAPLFFSKVSHNPRDISLEECGVTMPTLSALAEALGANPSLTSLKYVPNFPTGQIIDLFPLTHFFTIYLFHQ